MSSADSKRASCQLLAKIWALNTRKMPRGGLPGTLWLSNGPSQSQLFDIYFAI